MKVADDSKKQKVKVAREDFKVWTIVKKSDQKRNENKGNDPEENSDDGSKREVDVTTIDSNTITIKSFVDWFRFLLII